VLKFVYLYRMEKEDEDKHPIKVSQAEATAIIILVAGIILLGTAFGPWFGAASKAVLTLF
jgi:hypothetical protein